MCGGSKVEHAPLSDSEMIDLIWEKVNEPKGTHPSTCACRTCLKARGMEPKPNDWRTDTPPVNVSLIVKYDDANGMPYIGVRQWDGVLWRYHDGQPCIHAIINAKWRLPQ